jgi:hypothetical protein
LRIWTFTPREEHRPYVFENRVLKILGSKRDEAGLKGDWRILHNEKLRDFHFSQNLFRGSITKDHMNVACGTNRGRREMHTWKKMKKSYP